MLTEKKRARFIIGKRRVTVWCCVAKHSFCSVKNRLPHYFFSLIQFSLNCFRWDFSSSCVFDSFHPNWLYSDIFIITASFVIIKQFVSRCILHPLQNWQVSRTKNNRMGKKCAGCLIWFLSFKWIICLLHAFVSGLFRVWSLNAHEFSLQ